MYGAAWGTTIALVIYNIIKLFVVKRKLGIQPFSGKMVLVVIALAAGLAVGYLLPVFKNPFVDTIYRSAAIVIVYAILLLVFKPSEDLNSYLASVRKNKRLF